MENFSSPQKRKIAEEYIFRVVLEEEKLKGIVEKYKLTPRESKLLSLLLSSISQDEIAKTLKIKKNTLKSYLKVIYSKLDINSRMKLIAKLRGESPVLESRKI